MIPYLKKEYDLVHIPIPHSEDFDEIIDILFQEFKEENKSLGIFFWVVICFIFAITYPNRVNRFFTVAATPGIWEIEAEIERRKEKFVAIEKKWFCWIIL